MVGEYSTIKFEKIGNIAKITLNRPHRLNAINEEMLRELLDALSRIEMDEDIRCVVITGEGDRAFSAGADVTAFPGMSAARAVEASKFFQRVFKMIEEIPQPVICSINGFCLGGGLELAIACDFRIAAEHAELGNPEINLGIIPGAGATQRLARIVGLANAKKIVMLGERISAHEALNMGLVDKVVPYQKLEEETMNLARKLAESPPIALRLAKAALNFGTQVPLDIGLKLESGLFGISFSTKDFIEGIEAFMSKRKPEFKGK